jgi:glycosyltransferase involved in cell wall biosynthesis
MKILVISNPTSADGAQASLRLATTYWKSIGWEIDLFIPPDSHGPQADDPIITKSGLTRIHQIVNGANYHLVIINGMPHFSYLGVLSGVKIVLWVHEASEILWGSAMPVNVWMKYFSKAHKIIFSTEFQSEIVFKSFVQNLPRDRFAYGSLAVPPTQRIKNSRVDHNIFSVVTTGSIILRKRPDLLVNSTLLLRQRFPIKLDFIGALDDSWSLGGKFCELIKNPPKFIRWHGRISQVQKEKLLSTADVYCSPSDSESFGLAPLEAASINLPVVLANLPAYKYVGWRHEENCLLFTPGDVNSLTQCLEKIKLDSNLRNSLIRGGLSLAKQYSTEKFLENITRIIVSTTSD